jgi:hypothetical protein
VAVNTYAEALKDLSKLLVAVEPFGEHLVLAGGFAAWLYRFVEPYDNTGPELFTQDIDYAVPRRLPAELPSLAEALHSIEFVAVRSRDKEPPVMVFQDRRWGDEEKAPVYAEFLAPLRGKPTGSVVAVEPGVNAMLLRYMDLALDGPIALDVSKVETLDVPDGTLAYLPHPAHFVLHKALTAPLRATREKRHKDFAYLYDVVVRTRRGWPEMRERLAALEGQGERAAWLRRARADLVKWFGEPTGQGCVAAAAVWNDREPALALTPEEVCIAMRMGLAALGLTTP